MATSGVTLSQTELVVERLVYSCQNLLSVCSLYLACSLFEIDMWLKSEETKSHIRSIFLLVISSIFFLVIHTCLSL